MLFQFCASEIAPDSIEFRIHQQVASLRADKDGEAVDHRKNGDDCHSA
jgi:hypothetical protein